MRFQCPECDTTLELPQVPESGRVFCYNCGGRIEIARSGDASASSPNASASANAGDSAAKPGDSAVAMLPDEDDDELSMSGLGGGDETSDGPAAPAAPGQSPAVWSANDADDNSGLTALEKAAMAAPDEDGAQPVVAGPPANTQPQQPAPPDNASATPTDDDDDLPRVIDDDADEPTRFGTTRKPAGTSPPPTTHAAAPPQQQQASTDFDPAMVAAAAAPARAAAGLPPAPNQPGAAPPQPQQPAQQPQQPPADPDDPAAQLAAAAAAGGDDAPNAGGFNAVEEEMGAAGANFQGADGNLLMEATQGGGEEDKLSGLHETPGACPQCGSKNMMAGGMACMDCNYSRQSLAVPTAPRLSAGGEILAFFHLVTGTVVGRIALAAVGVMIVVGIVIVVIATSFNEPPPPTISTADTPDSWRQKTDRTGAGDAALFAWVDGEEPAEAEPLDKPRDPVSDRAFQAQKRREEESRRHLAAIARVRRLMADKEEIDSETLDVLVEALGNHDNVVGNAALGTLKELGPDVLPRVSAQLTVGNPIGLARMSQLFKSYGQAARPVLPQLKEALDTLLDPSVTILDPTNKLIAMRATTDAIVAIAPDAVDTATWGKIMKREKDATTALLTAKLLLKRHAESPMDDDPELVQALLELVGAEQLNGEIDDATAARLAGADLLFAVTKHNPKEVIQQLARMLTAVDHKRAATATIKAFGMYGYRSVRPILKLKTEALMRVTGTEPQFPMFRDADERGVGGKAWEVAPDEVVDRCHRVLEHAGGDALTEMLEIIRQPGNDTLRAVTIDTVTPLLPGNEDEAIPVLVDQLSDPVTAPKARELILSLKPHPRAAVPELLGDSFLQGGTAEADDKRKKLTDYIEALKGDGLPLIEHLLSHPEPTIQRTAVRLLSKLAPAERDALDVAIKALGCSDRTARNSAITTILIYGRAAIPKLQPLARETNRNVTIREGAKQALSLLGAG